MYISKSSSPHPDADIPTMRLRFVKSSEGMAYSEAPNTAPFIRGPIPIAWLSQAAALPGKALHLALAIQWLSGMNKGAPAKVSKKALAHFCISMDAYRDGLKRLEAAGLITVARLPGQSPFVRVVRPAQPQ
jgi:hypothetical protein